MVVCLAPCLPRLLCLVPEQHAIDLDHGCRVYDQTCRSTSQLHEMRINCNEDVDELVDEGFEATASRTPGSEDQYTPA